MKYYNKFSVIVFVSRSIGLNRRSNIDLKDCELCRVKRTTRRKLQEEWKNRFCIRSSTYKPWERERQMIMFRVYEFIGSSAICAFANFPFNTLSPSNYRFRSSAIKMSVNFVRVTMIFSFFPFATHHIAVQSKCTINHLLGLNAIESAYSIPWSQPRNSGHTNALPA